MLQEKIKSNGGSTPANLDQDIYNAQKKASLLKQQVAEQDERIQEINADRDNMTGEIEEQERINGNAIAARD